VGGGGGGGSDAQALSSDASITPCSSEKILGILWVLEKIA
jgi:hypothetical protein